MLAILDPSRTRMAQRLRAHARLCRHIAVASWNEEAAVMLNQLAEDCVLAAERLEPAVLPVPDAAPRTPAVWPQPTVVGSAR